MFIGVIRKDWNLPYMTETARKKGAFPPGPNEPTRNRDGESERPWVGALAAGADEGKALTEWGHTDPDDVSYDEEPWRLAESLPSPHTELTPDDPEYHAVQHGLEMDDLNEREADEESFRQQRHSTGRSVRGRAAQHAKKISDMEKSMRDAIKTAHKQGRIRYIGGKAHLDTKKGMVPLHPEDPGLTTNMREHLDRQRAKLDRMRSNVGVRQLNIPRSGKQEGIVHWKPGEGGIVPRSMMNLPRQQGEMSPPPGQGKKVRVPVRPTQRPVRIAPPPKSTGGVVVKPKQVPQRKRRKLGVARGGARRGNLARRKKENE